MKLRLRLWPRSLLGQMLLAVAAALLLAQIIAVILLVHAQDQRREELLMNAAAYRLITGPEARADHSARPDEQAGRPGSKAGPWERRSPGFVVERRPRFAPRHGDLRRTDREALLVSILAEEGIAAAEVAVYSRKLGDDPVAMGALQSRPRWRDIPRLGDRELMVAAIRSEPGGDWVLARMPVPPRETRSAGGIVAQTLLIYLVLVGGLALLLRRITRPLADLTRRVEHFARTREPEGQIVPRGPSDTRQLIEAHNAMENSIAALLDEKDVMLGAIGHDLKTPLAALRVRIEGVEDDQERAKMAASIEDITRTLDDILSLARVGRSTDPREPTELSALLASVVEEYEDMGEPVAMDDGPRLVLHCRATWLRRALRNLVGNALRYGSVARVSLIEQGGQAVFRIDDDGPGIPDADISAMVEPFRRGEASRNRGTGGAGLGLAIARAIADQHGGELVLANRPGVDGASAGLRAELRLPLR